MSAFALLKTRVWTTKLEKVKKLRHPSFAVTSRSLRIWDIKVKRAAWGVTSKRQQLGFLRAVAAEVTTQQRHLSHWSLMTEVSWFFPGAFQALLCPVQQCSSPTLFEGHALNLLNLSLTLYFADTSTSNNATLYWMFTSLKRYLYLSLHFHSIRLCRLRSSNIYHAVSCFP